MFGLLRQGRMVGGVVFGPPAWLPVRVENVFATPSGEGAVQSGPRQVPTERREFAAFLEELGIDRTSGIIPSAASQIRGLGTSEARALVLSLLPTQPEFALPAALSRLAMEDVHAGLLALYPAIRPQRIIIALDRHDYAVRRLWKRALRRNAAAHFARDAGPVVECRPLLNRHPQGHPTILMRTLFRKRLRPSALPSRLNRVIVDPVTCWALGRWLRTGEAFTGRPVQVFMQDGPRSAPLSPPAVPATISAAPSAKTPSSTLLPLPPPPPRGTAPSALLLMAPIGQTVAAFFEQYGLPFEGRQIILNGMLAGEEIDPRSARIEPFTESLSIRMPLPAESPAACLACGWCVDVCPTALTPVRLMELSSKLPAAAADVTLLPSEAKLLRSRDARESLNCIGCGLCSYVCPTRLPLTEEILSLQVRVVHSLHPSASQTAAAQSPPSPPLPRGAERKSAP